MSFASAFLSAPAVGPAPALAELDAKLRAHWETARAAAPGVELDARAFARGLGDRTRGDLDALHTADVYLALACLEGSRAALALFEARYLSRVEHYVARLRLGANQLDEVRQATRERLFVHKKIAQYGGLGPLDAWVRVSVLRTALNLGAARGRSKAEPEALARAAAPGNDVELDYLKARYRGDVSEALSRALATLDPRQRTLLRMVYVDEQSATSIARVFGVHRTTASRWTDEAQDALRTTLRRTLAERLELDQDEAASLARLVCSNVDLSLARLLASTAV